MPSPTSRTRSDGPLNQKQAAALTRLWQERLRLADWLIDVRVSDPGADCAGSIVPDPCEKTATLTVGAGGAAFQESVIVHELLHLALLPLWDGDCTESDVTRLPKETALNLLAWSLIAGWEGRRTSV